MKTIVGFGDSFIFGSELEEYEDGSGAAWPAIVSQQLGYKYLRQAKPGCGNDHIARQIYSYFAANTAENTLAVINWTWISRWDFYLIEKEDWITLGPSCVPPNLSDTVGDGPARYLIDFYNTRANSSILWNKFRNLQTIMAVQQYLDRKGINSVQTYMDYNLFDQTWHAPDYVVELQEFIRPKLQLFDNKNFLDWSYDNKYPVTIQGMHPLKEAHQAAAEYWKDIYKF